MPDPIKKGKKKPVKRLKDHREKNILGDPMPVMGDELEAFRRLKKMKGSLRKLSTVDPEASDDLYLELKQMIKLMKKHKNQFSDADYKRIMKNNM